MGHEVSDEVTDKGGDGLADEVTDKVGDEVGTPLQGSGGARPQGRSETLRRIEFWTRKAASGRCKAG